MKLSITSLLLPFWLLAQKPDPVHFDYSIKKINDTKVEVHLTATMDEGWHIYSQTQPQEAIAEPTKIIFNKNPLLIISGKPKEIGTIQKYEDKQAGIVQYQYSFVEFVQQVTLKSNSKADPSHTLRTNISGTITYQACTDQMCLPPKTVSFSIVI